MLSRDAEITTLSYYPFVSGGSRSVRFFIFVQVTIIITANVWLNCAAPESVRREPAIYVNTGQCIEPADSRNAPILDERIAINIRHATIPQALKAIERETPLWFAFKPSALAVSATVSLDARGITIREALTIVLLNADVDVELGADGRALIIPRSDRVAFGRCLASMKKRAADWRRAEFAGESSTTHSAGDTRCSPECYSLTSSLRHRPANRGGVAERQWRARLRRRSVAVLETGSRLNDPANDADVGRARP